MKSVKMLNSGTENLDQILNSGQSSSNRCGLGVNSLVKSASQANGIKFVLVTINIKPNKSLQLISLNSSLQKVVFDGPPEGDAKILFLMN
uniref:Uncharacterized protein n=1 Tax=Cucumis melo TaxID=3656 RepID=A0A9I9EJZ9_CUCME